MGFFNKRESGENTVTKNHEIENKSNIFTNFLVVLLVIAILTATSVFAYPIGIKAIEGNTDGYNKVANYVLSESFMNEQFNSLLDYKMMNRQVLRAIEGNPEQLLAIQKAAGESDDKFSLGKYADFVPEINDGTKKNPVFAKYYIADEDKKLVQTNLSQEEIKNVNAKDKLLYLRFTKSKNDIFTFEKEDAKSNFPLVNYKDELEYIFDEYKKQSIPDYVAGLLNATYWEEREYENSDERIDGFSFDHGRDSYGSVRRNEYRIDGTSLEVRYPSAKEKDKKTIELINNITKQIENLPKEDFKGVYYLPQNLKSTLKNQSYDYYDRVVMESRMILVAVIAGAAILFMMLFTIIVPYRYQRKSSIVSRFNELPLEIKWFITVIIGAIPFAFMFLGIVSTDQRDPMHDQEWVFANKMLQGNTTEYLAYASAAAFICLFLVYLHMCYIKKIFNEGLVNGFIKDSVILNAIYRFVRFAWRNVVVAPTGFVKQGISRIKEIYKIDLDKDFKRKFMLIGIVQCILIFIIAVLLNNITVLGLTIIVIYGVIVFKWGYKFLLNLMYVQDFSKKLAEGNFEVQADENLGVFRKTAKNLNSVKIGFKKALDEEIKSQNMKTELISNVSHDLKTPLTSIINYSDLLSQEGLSEEAQKEYIETIHKKSERLKRLIEDLFEASKASSGNITLNKEKLDVIAVFRQTMGELEEKISASGLDFRVSTPPSPVYAMIDGQKMYRIFSNIIGNITKYSLRGTRVYIDAKLYENDISFEFKNISNYEMNFEAGEVLERFKRGDESRNTEGSGLGLAIAKSLVELHGGSLSVDIDGDLFKLILTINKSR